MPLLRKLTSAFLNGRGEADRELERYQCLNCGSTFQSPHGSSKSACPGCASSRIRSADRASEPRTDGPS